MSTTNTTIDMAREIAEEYSKAERFQTWTYDYMMERLMELVTVSAAAEREACAKVCEAGVDYEHPTVKGHIMENFGHSRLLAKAIRNRGNT